MYLLKLPTDIFFEIFGSYNQKELCNCMSICKELKEIVQSNVLWKKFIEKHHKLTSESSYINCRNNTITFDFFHKISKRYYPSNFYGGYNPNFMFTESNPKHAFSNKLLKIKSVNLVNIPDEIFILDNIMSVTISIANDYCPQGFSKLKSLKNLSRIEIIKETKDKETYLEENFNNVVIELSTISTLTSLSLKNNTLKKLPESFKNLVNLSFLDLSNNCFESIPNVICSLTKLVTINLSENKIKQIPKELSEMDNLYELDLTNNKITVLENISNELSELKINYNPIETINNDCLNNFDSIVKFKCNNGHLKTDDDRKKLNILKQKVQSNLKKIENLTY